MLVFLDRCMHLLAANSDGAHSISSDPEVINAALAARCLSMWFDRLERAPRFMSPTQGKELHDLGVKYVRLIERLSVIGLCKNVNRWRLRPKLHAFLHISEDHLRYRVCARTFHCYVDEDFVGLVKRLSLKCHRGDLLELRIILRWLLRIQTWVPAGGVQ